jgi:lipopolysaccharide export system ATP-binding protein
MENLEVEAKNICKTYGDRKVVKNVSLSVKTSEVVGLLGPNGAGKTTSFYMIVGLVKANSGSIHLGDKNITADPLHKRAISGIGYLPQEASVFRDLTVRENILAAAEVKRYSKSEKNRVVDQLLEDFNLKTIYKSLGRALSGGERRRVEIARVLALNPKFILLDEPFAGVDPLAVIDIQKIIKALKNRGIGVLITDHNVRETLGIVDRAYILSQGEILAQGTPEEILQNEQARKFYLGENFKM